jgi:hypothetical protein
MRRGLPDRRLTAAIIGGVAVVALYLALPAIAGLDETWRLLQSGNAWWLGLGVVLEVGSYADRRARRVLPRVRRRAARRRDRARVLRRDARQHAAAAGRDRRRRGRDDRRGDRLRDR